MGLLFAVLGTDSFDIALAAEEVDICQAPFDGDPAEPGAAQEVDYDRAWRSEYQIITDPMCMSFPTSTPRKAQTKQLNDFFTLFDFSAKWDITRPC